MGREHRHTTILLAPVGVIAIGAVLFALATILAAVAVVTHGFVRGVCIGAAIVALAAGGAAIGIVAGRRGAATGATRGGGREPEADQAMWLPSRDETR